MRVASVLQGKKKTALAGLVVQTVASAPPPVSGVSGKVVRAKANVRPVSWRMRLVANVAARVNVLVQRPAVGKSGANARCRRDRRAALERKSAALVITAVSRSGLASIVVSGAPGASVDRKAFVSLERRTRGPAAVPARFR